VESFLVIDRCLCRKDGVDLSEAGGRGGAILYFPGKKELAVIPGMPERFYRIRVTLDQ